MLVSPRYVSSYYLPRSWPRCANNHACAGPGEQWREETDPPGALPEREDLCLLPGTRFCRELAQKLPPYLLYCGFVRCTFRQGTCSRFSYNAYMPSLASVGWFCDRNYVTGYLPFKKMEKNVWYDKSGTVLSRVFANLGRAQCCGSGSEYWLSWYETKFLIEGCISLVLLNLIVQVIHNT